MKKDVDGQIPNYPNLPSKLLCLLHNVTLHVRLTSIETLLVDVLILLIFSYTFCFLFPRLIQKQMKYMRR